jgi:hypothetical protein
MNITGLKSQRNRLGALAAICGYVLAAFFASTPALGREISDAERVALKTAVSEFTAAMREGDFARQISGSLTPRFIELLAKKGGITAEALREQMIATLEKTMQIAKIESFAIDLDRAEFAALPSGEPYALIPTTTKIVIKPPNAFPKDKTHAMIENGKTLALIENGKWYLMRVSGPPKALFREAYPEFAQAGLPEGTVEILKNEP